MNKRNYFNPYLWTEIKKHSNISSANFFKYSNQGDTLVKIGTGKWSFKIESYDGKNDMYVSGKFLNGMKDGIWTIGSEEKLVVEEQYEKGKFIKGEYYKNIKGKKTKEPLITSWIFINTPLERMERLIISNDKVKKDYPFIKFRN